MTYRDNFSGTIFNKEEGTWSTYHPVESNGIIQVKDRADLRIINKDPQTTDKVVDYLDFI